MVLSKCLSLIYRNNNKKRNKMTTLKLQAKHEDTLVGQFLNAVSQVNYNNANIAPFYSEMEKWEMKEYVAVNNGNLEIIENCKKAMMENEAIFNEMLSEYNLTVAVFINKYSN